MGFSFRQEMMWTVKQNEIGDREREREISCASLLSRACVAQRFKVGLYPYIQATAPQSDTRAIE